MNVGTVIFGPIRTGPPAAEVKMAGRSGRSRRGAEGPQFGIETRPVSAECQETCMVITARRQTRLAGKAGQCWTANLVNPERRAV